MSFGQHEGEWLEISCREANPRDRPAPTFEDASQGIKERALLFGVWDIACFEWRVMQT
jgi:hypothetical protein